MKKIILLLLSFLIYFTVDSQVFLGCQKYEISNEYTFFNKGRKIVEDTLTSDTTRIMVYNDDPDDLYVVRSFKFVNDTCVSYSLFEKNEDDIKIITWSYGENNKVIHRFKCLTLFKNPEPVFVLDQRTKTPIFQPSIDVYNRKNTIYMEDPK